MRSDSMILYPTLFQSFPKDFKEREREKEGFFFFLRMREKEGWGVVSQKRGCFVE